jgi:hypothetical protein
MTMIEQRGWEERAGLVFQPPASVAALVSRLASRLPWGRLCPWQ